MPFEALRFIHATGLLVDHQVRDVGAVSDAARSLIIDASLKSFERLVAEAVDQGVDFVLLTGDTFCERDRSLRARVAIVSGLRCLDEAGIQAFVVPGSEDPADAWHAINRLPDNVTVFDPVRDEPTAVMRDGQVIATLQGCSVWTEDSVPARSSERQPLGQTRLGPLRIGIVPPLAGQAPADQTLADQNPAGQAVAEHGARSQGRPAPDEAMVERWLEQHRVDYLALSRPFHRLRVLRPEQVAFCPGGAVPVTRADTGVRGAALISAEGRASVNLSLVPTSPLRRETFHLVLDESTSWDQLIAVMRSAIEKLSGLNETRVLLADWHLEGSGDVLASLQNDDSQAELIELFSADDTARPAPLIEHRVCLQQTEDTASAGSVVSRYSHGASSAGTTPAGASPDDAGIAPDEADGTVAGGFFHRLDRAESIAGDVVQRLCSRGAAASGGVEGSAPWARRLDVLSTRVDSRATAAAVRRLAEHWFAGEGSVAAVSGSAAIASAGTATDTSATDMSGATVVPGTVAFEVEPAADTDPVCEPARGRDCEPESPGTGEDAGADGNASTSPDAGNALSAGDGGSDDGALPPAGGEPD